MTKARALSTGVGMAAGRALLGSWQQHGPLKSGVAAILQPVLQAAGRSGEIASACARGGLRLPRRMLEIQYSSEEAG